MSYIIAVELSAATFAIFTTPLENVTPTHSDSWIYVNRHFCPAAFNATSNNASTLSFLFFDLAQLHISSVLRSSFFFILPVSYIVLSRNVLVTALFYFSNSICISAKSAAA